MSTIFRSNLGGFPSHEQCTIDISRNCDAFVKGLFKPQYEIVETTFNKMDLNTPLMTSEKKCEKYWIF